MQPVPQVLPPTSRAATDRSRYVLSIARGYSTDYLTNEVARGRESYYLDAAEGGLEPPGQWYGAGAETLGLRGEVDANVLEAVYTRLVDPRGGQLPITRPNYRSAEDLHAEYVAAEPGATPERRDELWAVAQSKARQSVAFLDATFSAPKSVSVVGVAFERAAVEAEREGRTVEAEAWRAHLHAVEEAVRVGARASVEYLEDVAGYSRSGNKDAMRWVAAHKFVVAGYLQHDSRERDPQLHVHQAILNAVECEDGKWRTLDGQALYLHKPAAGAYGERMMEAYLAQTLGLRFATRPDGKAREVVGVAQDVTELFSSRVRAITPRLEELCREWERLHGAPPNALERTRLAQRATLETRPGKSHDGETLEQRLERWDAQTRQEVGAGLRATAEAVLAARQDAGAADTWDPADVVERAVQRVAESKSTWTRAELMRAVSDCLPGHLGVAPDEIRPLLDRLTDEALATAVRISPEVDLSLRPAEHLLEGTMDVYSRPGSTLHSAAGQVPAERALRAAAVERGAMAVPAELAAQMIRRYREHGVELGADQIAALRGIVTSGARMEVVTSAAGCGKTRLVGALAGVWAEHGRAVIGLAPSQNAADVMRDEGLFAVNIDRWLLQRDHGIQDGDVVVVDECGMASTQHLLAVWERCRAVGAKLLLVGDPEQLGAVGPGGSLKDLTEHAVTYDLAEVRRFTHPWERNASLQLRSGDPGALDAYERAGRIRGAGTAEQAEAKAVRAWLADTLEGRQSLLLVGSNDAAERMSGEARAELVRLGMLPEAGITLGRDGNTCGVGDLVQARFNGWRLGTAQAPVNRATYRVVEVHEDGGLTVAPVVEGKTTAAFDLPADYVRTNMTLGYASTVHAGQGRTVDTAHSVIGPGSSRSQTYVSMTRGRESNTAWCVTLPTAMDSPPGEAQKVEERTGRAVLADILDRDSLERSALAERDALEHENRSELTVVGQLLDGIHRSTAGQTSHLLDLLCARGAITEDQRVDLVKDEAMSAVERALRTAELRGGRSREEILEQALEGRSLAGSDSVGRVLHHRIHRDLQVDSTISSYRNLISPNVRDYHLRWLESRADDADVRRHELGAEIALDPPVWALEALGPVPEDVLERQGWEAKAGWAAAYREMAGHESETDPLGPAPPAGLAEKHSIWRTAHHHLDLQNRGPEEGLLSDGALRSRVAAYEREKTWAAASVRGQLSDTAQAADEKRVDGVLREAHGDDTALDAQAEAVVLGETTALLDEADRARQAWTEHTSETAEKAKWAGAELTARGVDLSDESGKVTAREWLDAHRAEQVQDERRKPIDQVADDHDTAELAPVDEESPETLVADVRDSSERHPSEDVDAAGETSLAEARDLVARAQETLTEIANRESLDAAADHEGYDLHVEDDFSEDAMADAWD